MTPPHPPAFERLLALKKRDPNFLHGFVTALALAPPGWEPEDALDALRQVELEPGAETLTALLDSVDEAFQALSQGSLAPLIEAGPVVEGMARWQAGFDLAMSLDLDSWEARNENDIDAGKAFVHLISLSRPDIAELIYGVPESEHESYVREQLVELPDLLSYLHMHYHMDDLALDLAAGEIDPTMFDLPEFSDQELAGLDAPATFERLIELEDAVPRELFDHAVALGDALVPLLREHLDNPLAWNNGGDDEDADLWWGLHHAAYILGMQSSPAAGEALLHALRQQQRHPDDELWIWLSEAWPALFANKGEATVSQLQAIMEDTTLDEFLRINAMQALTQLCRQQGAEALEQQLDRVATLTQQAEPGSSLEDLSAMHLLEFPRPRHRPLLEDKARRFEQREDGVPFDLDEVALSFDRGDDHPEWDRFADPWAFYDPEAIRQRQARWLREAAEEYLDASEEVDEEWLEDLPPPEPFQREQPKLGRNDPCPCGSGKKYKKCCLH